MAVGIKLWPIVLAPIILRRFLRKPKALIAALFLFVALIGIQALALASSFGMGDASGLLAYGERWEMNDALFMVIRWCAQQFPGISTYDELATRLAVVALVGFVVLLNTYKEKQTPGERYAGALWVMTALFMLSPTQFPWYYTWVLPFLVFTPRPSLLLLTALLPLYYLRFYFKEINNVEAFDNGIVWLEFAPVWCMLIIEKYYSRSGPEEVNVQAE